ncbi:MAG: hypothetical protein HY690_12170 [Chloroflexi bacterium]|nr:hypothetical protein [Chloroflexota bacterium]
MGVVRRTDLQDFLNADAAELLIYSRALSQDEQVQVEAYLRGKYGHY